MMIHTPISPATTRSHGNRPGSPAAPASSRSASKIYGKPVSNGNGSSNGHLRSHGRRKKTKRGKSFWKPWKLILVSVLIGILGSLYLTHVFQTQQILFEVQQLRRDHERAERLYDDTRRNYDRMTGPAEVYRRAESMGMITGGAADPVIFIGN